MCYTSLTLWFLGYPDQALKRIHEVLALAQELSHPYSLAYAMVHAAWFHQFRREWRVAQEQAVALQALSQKHGFVHWLAEGIIFRGWVLAEQGYGKEGIAHMRQGLADFRTIGSVVGQTGFLTHLAAAHGRMRQIEEGMRYLAEALVVVDKTGERSYEAELYRLYGELSL